MTQKQKVYGKIKELGTVAIKELAASLDILRPNIRRILHLGVEAGDLERVEKGVYQFTSSNGEVVGIIECADALDALPRLVKEGKKFDTIILDPPYYSVNLIGRNRMKIKDWYEFIKPDKFKLICQYLPMLLTDKGQVVMFLSSARSAQKELSSYLRSLDAVLYTHEQGSWQKVYSNGNFVLSINGQVSPPESITIWRLYPSETDTSLSNVCPELQFQAPRGGKGTYRTEKPLPIINSLLQYGMKLTGWVLDLFAGSGVTGEAANQLGLNFHLIEKNPDTINNFILPRLQ